MACRRRSLLALEASSDVVNSSVQQKASVTVTDTLLSIIPTNIFQAAATNNLLGVMFFSVLFGFFLARIELPYRQTVLDLAQGVFRVMMRMTIFIMSLAPIGIFGLTAKVVAKSGIHAAGPILTFGACVVAGILIYARRRITRVASPGGHPQSLSPVLRHEPRIAHGVLDRVVGRGIAAEPGIAGKARERI